MNDVTPRKAAGSLLERAAERYDFGAQLRGHGVPDLAGPEPDPIRPPSAQVALEPEPEPDLEPLPEAAREPEPVSPPAPTPLPIRSRLDRGGAVAIDRELLAENGLLVPGAPIGALVEEFRQIKRQLIQTARTVQASDGDRSRTVLVCSSKPGDGKTYCAVNLAIAMAAERDIEVVLVDADFAKPDVMARLGLEDGLGLLDALADPDVDIEDYVIETDIPQLSLLPAGTKSNTDTELLASKRTSEVIAALLARDPRRVLIFDSPPVLAATPASLLANHAGQVMLVVRADRTSEGDLREAVVQLDGCEHIQLVLNAVSFTPGGRRYGGYYGHEDAA